MGSSSFLLSFVEMSLHSLSTASIQIVQPDKKQRWNWSFRERKKGAQQLHTHHLTPCAAIQLNSFDLKWMEMCLDFFQNQNTRFRIQGGRCVEEDFVLSSSFRGEKKLWKTWDMWSLTMCDISGLMLLIWSVKWCRMCHLQRDEQIFIGKLGQVQWEVVRKTLTRGTWCLFFWFFF